MKKLNFFDKFLFLINSLVAILLLFTYVLPYVDPQKFPTLAILSLAYPAIVITNCMFIVFWIIKLKPQFILSTISLLIGLSTFNAFFSFDDKEIIKNDDIKLMSFNVRRFNVFNWIKSPTIKQEICDFVSEQDPDIICMQEYINEKNVSFNIPYSYIYKTRSSGIAIYSKYKILNKGAINFKNTANNVIFADLKINKEIIRVYNVHLQSFRLDTQKEHYGDKDNEALLKKFKSVFSEQSHQIKILKTHINECSYRTIVTGDFNNTAFSWNYHEIIEGRKDAFVEAGIGFGKSYHYFFPFRIDFILPDNSMDVGKFTTYNVNLSDHDPIMARINLNN